MKIIHESNSEIYNLHLSFGKYSNGQTSIRLYDLSDGFPFGVATVAVNESISKDEIAIKNYSENEGILDSLVKAEVINPPHRFIKSGFVTIPICKLLINIE